MSRAMGFNTHVVNKTEDAQNYTFYVEVSAIYQHDQFNRPYKLRETLTCVVSQKHYYIVSETIFIVTYVYMCD